MATNTVETARREIRGVLRRYRLRWEDVAPDPDEMLWKQLKPSLKRIRRGLFRERYPSLYARTRTQ